MSCGPGKIGNWFVPNNPLGLKVGACCEHHDRTYQNPGIRSRLDCDKEFLKCMLRGAHQFSGLRRALYVAVAHTCYWAVRAGGWKAWQRSQKQGV